jgi:sulfonate transport system permease protein
MIPRVVTRLRVGVPWVLPALLLLVWQAGSDLGLVKPDVLPAPTDVAVAGWHLALSGELLRNTEVSAWRATVGFLIGGSIGFVLGLLNGLSAASERVLDSTFRIWR